MSTTSNTYINTTAFNKREGTYVLPERKTTVFNSPTSNHVGAQVSGKKGQPFQLILTRYVLPSERSSFRAFINSLNGTAVNLMIDGMQFSLPQYGGYMFLVSHARVVDDVLLPAACGYLDGERFDYSPAIKIKSQLVMHAVPA
ncbi:hypothetical protein LOC67_23355 [Stieleria sp. JC731]|uniref:hypothetical protein n=1 Tax=Pirellulaceae TaxID=2691357 RepID=UPI001E55CC08|nr:hypothetical protein [Stieleria sp. JC731]MCC9603497.1 hypothetical protein [Stieleria sp. JC731]